MKIEYNPTFRKNFGIIWDFISQDSLNRADSFKNQLKEKISKLPKYPYKFRQLHYYDNENVRDMIFKGYTVPYLVDTDKNLIVILDIFKWSKR